MILRCSILLFFQLISQAVAAQPDCVSANCCCGDIQQESFPGGNFEDPPNPPPGGRISFFAGETYSAWTIESGSIDLLEATYGVNWAAGNPNGASNFIDLHGFQPATITTQLNNLSIGCTYTIVLWYARNEGVVSGTCTATVAGGAWLTDTWTATNAGSEEWLERCLSFTALAANAEFQLVGSGPSITGGMILDDFTLWRCCSDIEPPVVNAPNSPVLVQCIEDVPPPPTLSPTDNCNLPIDIELSEIPGAGPCAYNITRNWIVTDGCGNTTTTSQLIEIEDTTPPGFDVFPQDYTTSCSTLAPNEFLDWVSSNGLGFASDNCGFPVSWDANFIAPPDGTCKVTTVTFVISDICGNTSEATAYFIVEDFEPPILLTPAKNIVLQCNPNDETIFNNWLANNGGALVTDPCEAIQWSNDFDGNFSGEQIDILFTAVDGCQNTVTTSASFINPINITNISIFEETCNPLLVGVDTVSAFLGNCETMTITSTNWSGSDTTLLFDNTCNPNLAGVFTQNLNGQLGCDSLVITTITWASSDTTLLFDNTCDPNSAGVFAQNLNGQSGCDSLVITTITWASSDTTLLFDNTCDPNLVGVFIQNLTNQSGCDSLVITSISWSVSDTTLLFNNTCNLNLAGVFTQNLYGQSGCDSLVITTVTWTSSDTTLLFDNTCDPNLTGVFTQNLNGQSGCDSLVITTITWASSDTTLLFDKTCDPNLTGVFTQNLNGQSGCDSLVITIITWTSSDTTLLFYKTCDPNLVGVFTQNLNGQSGCDSLVITTITWTSSDTTLLFDKTCDPNLTGVFTQNLSGQSGCDSLVITTITWASSDTTLLFDNTCDPNLAGVFTQNLNGQSGCDSLVITTVTWTSSDTTLLFDKTCDPNLTGVFTQNLSGLSGCDSVVMTLRQLSSIPTITISLSDQNGFGVSCIESNDGTATATVQGDGPFSYLWSTGDTMAVLSNLTAGTYSLTVTSINGCDATTTVSLIAPPVLLPVLQLLQPNCLGSETGTISIVANGGIEPYVYTLDGAVTQFNGTFSQVKTGPHLIEVTDANGCIWSDSLTILASNVITLNLNNVPSISLGDSVLLQASINLPNDALAEIIWTPGHSDPCILCASQMVAPVETTVYTIEVISKEGCRATDQWVIQVDRSKDIYVPNIFSPNEDGVNDVFNIFTRRNSVRSIQTFAIFDRWGECVFQVFDIQPNSGGNLEWDGTFRGKPLNPAVFVWYASVEFADGSVEYFSGDVTLTR